MIIEIETCIAPEEAATEIKVHVETIRRLLREKIIKGFKVGTGKRAHWRIPRNAWEEFKRGVAHNVTGEIKNDLTQERILHDTHS